jgi:ABC-2 type transport system ATP-binding protein
LYGLRGRELSLRVDMLLGLVQLGDRRGDRVKDFSGGMKRRLNIAASLMHTPEILFCDEPTVGVDPQSRNAIFDVLEHLNAEGVTVIYTTHYMEEVTRLCRHVAIIDHGRLIAQGSQAELLALLPRQRCVSFPATDSTSGFAGGSAMRFGELRKSPNGSRHQLFPSEPFDAPSFFLSARNAGVEPWAFSFEQGTLEDVFLHLTGRSLRD